jgi:hypothetical protein
MMPGMDTPPAVIEDAGVVDAPNNKVGRPPRDVAEWGAPFLRYVRRSGNISRSARKARVSPTTVRKHARAHPEFSRRIAAALREYGDRLEENLGVLAFKGNAIANIARLKGLSERLAAKYSEKAIDARITTNIYNDNRTVLTDSAALELVARLAPQLTQASMAKAQQQLAPAILDATQETA